MRPADTDGNAAARAPLQGLRLLVADDSPSTRRILAGMLERAGAVTRQVGDGSDVLQALRAEGAGFDAVILDLRMSRLGGLDAAQALREAAGSLPRPLALVLLSVDFDALELARVASVGAHPEPLRKPLQQRDVLRIVAAAVGRSLPSAEAPAVAEPRLPSLPGCDLAGALERCGGDRDLLVDLQSQMVNDAFRRGDVFAQSIRSRLYPIALGDLHRLRGDLLNLGFTEAASRVSGIETRTRELAQRASRSPESTVPSAVITGGDALALEMRDLLDRLSVTAASLRQLPALAILPARTEHAGGLAQDRFAALVDSLERAELAGFRKLDLRERVLPPRYTADVDAQFRGHLRRLDFPAALALLDAPDRKPGVRASGSGFRILIVDDMSSAVLLLHGMIGHIGQVRFALSAEAALEAVKDWSPDLVVSDVHLGGMSGIELCRRLKALPQGADSVVLLVSADGEVALEVEGLTAGATDFLSKPLNPARVVGRINAHLSALRRQSAFAVSVAREASSSVLGFVTCAFAGRIIDLSPRIARETGAQSAWKGRALQELLTASSEAAAAQALGEIARQGRVAPFEAGIQTEGGAVIPVRITGWSAPGATGRIAWFAFEDRRDALAGERRRFEDALSRSIGTLAGGMAHEFNNLLTVAIGNLDLALEAAGTDAGQRERLRRVSGALLRAAEISRRLGDFGLRDGGAPGARPPVQDLDRLIDQLWPLLSQGVPPGVVVVRDGGGQGAQVRIDARGLRTALTNLLMNAYAALPEGGQVTLRTRVAGEDAPDGRQALIELADTGRGMGPETLQRAFEPFYTTESPRHTGLGLTEVRGFVERQGGTAQLESMPGRGTLVRLAFPIADATAPGVAG